MSITFSPKEALAFISKTIAVSAAVAEGTLLPTAEIYGELLEGLIKGFSHQSAAKPIYQQLNNTIQSAVDALLHAPGYEIPSDCVTPLMDIFSTENALHYLKSSDPLSQINSAIISACRQSKNCDISTLPLERISGEMLTHVYDAIINHHELTGLISLVQTLEINRKLDTLITWISSIQCDKAERQEPLHPCGAKGVFQFNPRDVEEHLEQLSPPPLSKNERQTVIEKKSGTDYLEPNFREYIKAKFKDYQERNIEVGTPQLLSMALNCQGNKALDILNCFDAGGEYSGPYGKQLMHILDKVDQYYIRERRVYDDNQYISFQERLHTWIENSESTHKLITPITFTYFILKFSNGQTVNLIRAHLGTYYDDVLSFIRENQLPSFPASLI